MAEKKMREDTGQEAPDLHEGAWVVIPTALLHDLRISSTAKLLYGEISALCNKHGFCYATTEHLAAAMRIGARTVRRCIDELEAAGALYRELGPAEGRSRGYERRLYLTALVQKRDLAKNGQVANIGRETWPILAGSLLGSNNKYNTPEENIKETIPCTRTRAGASTPKHKPERFAAFWEWYRKNVRPENRQAAVKAWDKLKPNDELIGVIGRALKTQAASDEWRRGIGKPYASTYLNGHRWEDVDPDAPKKQGDDASEAPEAWGWGG